MIRGDTLTLYVLAAALSACTARRPSTPYASVARDCRSAATLLRSSGGGTPHMVPQMWRVRACPERAGAHLAVLLDTSRTVSDTAELEFRTFLIQYVHDARLISVAHDVAQDTGATVLARVAAIRTLLWAKSPGHAMGLGGLIAGRGCIPSRCSSSGESHYYRSPYVSEFTIAWPVFGLAPAEGYAARIDRALAELASSSATPVEVRRAAEHALLFPPARELLGR